MKYHYSRSFFTYSVKRIEAATLPSRLRPVGLRGRTCRIERPVPLRAGERRPIRGHRRAGSLTGAVHLSNVNAGVPRLARCRRKRHVERKGKRRLDPDLRYGYGTRKRGLTILLTRGDFGERCLKSYHRDNWLVAAKRS